MRNNTYLVESIIQSIKAKKEFRQADNEREKEFKKKRMRYLKYQQAGGQLSIDNFEDKEMRQYELDHRRNPKMYPNFKTWKKVKMEDRKQKAEIEEKESKNKRRNAQAAHEKSIANINAVRAARMKKENML